MWLLVLSAVVLVTLFVFSRFVDRETVKNLRFLGKIVIVLLFLLVLLAVVALIESK